MKSIVRSFLDLLSADLCTCRPPFPLPFHLCLTSLASPFFRIIRSCSAHAKQFSLESRRNQYVFFLRPLSPRTRSLADAMARETERERVIPLQRTPTYFPYLSSLLLHHNTNSNDFGAPSHRLGLGHQHAGRTRHGQADDGRWRRRRPRRWIVRHLQRQDRTRSGASDPDRAACARTGRAGETWAKKAAGDGSLLFHLSEVG